MIEPSISLAVKPVPYDPLQQEEMGMQAQNLINQQRLQTGQQQIQQQQIQENALKVQAAQRDANDQRIIPQALFQAKVGSDGALDIDDFKKQASNLGASWSGISTAEQQFNNVALTHARMTGEDLDNARKQSEGITESAGTLLKMPDADAAEQWPNSRADLITRFHIDPAQIPESYPGKNWLTANYKITAMNLAAIMNAQAHQASAQAAQSHWDNVQLRPGGILVHVGPDGSESPIGAIPSPQAPSQNGVAAPIPATPGQTTAPSQIPNPPVGGAQVAPIPAAGTGSAPVPMPPATGPGTRVIASNPAPVRPVVPRAPTTGSLSAIINDPNSTPEQVKQAKGTLATMAAQRPVAGGIGGPSSPPIVGPPITADTPHGDAYLAMLKPDDATIVRLYASGRRTFPTGVSAKAPYFTELQKQVSQFDPGFSEQIAQQRKGTMQQFTGSSPQTAGGQVLSLNTMVHHADLYMDAADALKNGNFVPGNAAYNAISTMMGHPAPNNVALISQFLAAETQKLATGGVPAEGEVKSTLAPLKSSNSPDQLRNAGQTLLGIASGRMIPLQEKADAAHLNDIVHVVGPDAAAILQRRGYDPATLKPLKQSQNQQGGAPTGTIHYVEGANHWDIPAARKADFEKSHPNAKAQ